MTTGLIIACIVVLVVIVWISFLVLYYNREHTLRTIVDNINSTLEKRLYTTPLLIELLKPHVVKKDQVFKKILTLRSKLLFQPNREKENEVSHQLEFLLQIATKHSEITQDRRFEMVQKEIEEHKQKVRESVQKYEAVRDEFQQLRKKSLFALFPGFFLIKLPQPLEITI